MAKKHLKEAKPPDAQLPRTEGRRFLRYCFVLALGAAVVLAWLSLLTFSPNDWPSRQVYPPAPPANAAGVVGAFIAYMLRYWIGGGIFLGLLFATVASMILMLGGRITHLPWRVVGLAILITATSTGVYLVNPAAASDVSGGRAGILGITAGQFLHVQMSWGAWVVVLAGLCVGIMFTADNLVLQLPRIGKKAWRRRGELPAAIAALRSRLPRAAVAEPNSVSVPASPRAVAAAPTAGGKTVKAKASAKTTDQPSQNVRMFGPISGAQAGGADTGGGGGEGRQYSLPSPGLLAEPTGGYIESQELQAAEKQTILQQTLNDFNVDAEVVSHMTGPVITLFELSLAPGVKVSQISNLAKDIARALAVPGVRVVSPIPGKDTVGIEVPNMDKEIVRLKELMNMAPDADKQMAIPLYLGKDAGGNAIVADLNSMPHLLIAGTTGSGKSVCINSIITSILMSRTPEDVRLILVDPKMVEMAAFEDIPHLLCPIVNDMRRTEDILEWAVDRMDERYELLKEANVKNVAGYNRLSKKELYKRFDVRDEQERKGIPLRMLYYVIIIDELADLIMTAGKEIEGHIIRIAQKARAVGIHMILATQRPSVNVVTGLIKSNMPCRISFRVASRQESRIVLDQNGADVLLGRGDMLFLQPGTSNLIRAQGTYVDESEIRSVVKELRGAGGPQFDAGLVRLNSRAIGQGGGEKDEQFDKAVEIVLATQRGSVSLLQRRLQIGYSRASRIIDQMADAGILGEYKGSQARECLMTLEQWQAMQASITADKSGASAANGEPMSV